MRLSLLGLSAFSGPPRPEADGYPDDPTRWGPPPSVDGASFGSVAITGGGVLILVIVGLLLFLRRRQSRFDQNVMNVQYSTNSSSQTLMQHAQPSSTQNQTFPVNQHQLVQSNPAKEYYQNLISQGYPHEHAVAYTQQYFPHFNR